ncbi:cyclopropane-fatty-acyl-phospholipid synthase [Neoconidiobolus thromboides FSU 785]|nr:cyclopropane-fatty-acyl-phospholipid synthase [Neoconidiobolus thromboides FSU 785]
MFSDLGLAESYLLDECEISNIADFLKLLVFNRSELTGQNGSTDITSKVFQTLDYISNTQLVNSINNTLNNISAHYDLGNDFFELFLDPTLTYSCPIWEELHDNEDEVRTKSLDEEFDELYSAQLRKLHTIIRKAKLCKEDHLLEIGSGWGALSIEAVKLTGCKVTTLTLSIEQKLLAEKKIAEAGYDTKINVVLMDYRDLLKSGMKFDKIISIEMIEAVGKEYLSTYFNCCHSVLKEEGGIMVLQGITIHESRYDDYCSRVDYIQKYIFPGGHTPSITALVNAIKDGSDNQLVINDINNIGMHYTRALRLWREKFILNYEKIRQIDPTKYDDIFKRTWLFYLAYCEAGFATHCIGDIIMVLSRPNNQAIHEGIPM